jgi:hypothetical protein
MGDPSVPPPSQTGSRFVASLMRGVKTLFILGVLGAGGFYGWQYGRPVWNKMRLNTDVESAGTFFVRQVPEKLANEGELKQRVASAADDKLNTYLARKARWFVAFGPKGSDLRIQRNDQFTDLEKKFASKAVDDALRRNDRAGTDKEALDYPRGAWTRAVSVGEERWVVVAAWAEDGK